MSLEKLHNRLGWPKPKDVFDPSGAGPQVLVSLAREKIQRTLQQIINGRGVVKVGLLTKNPNSRGTEAPVAVVCQFSSAINAAVCRKAHRLAWNFARSPLLVIIEPHQVRTWSCCEQPAGETNQLFTDDGEISEATLSLKTEMTASEQAAHALNWVRLATGDFYRQFPDRFKRDGRADRVLLQQLTVVRKRLQKQGLDDEEGDDIIHDLLARIVFAQFLFDRKDGDGQSALNEALLTRLFKNRTLLQQHRDLGTILADYDEAYRFFRWLNEKFNGDLFPGKGSTSKAREDEWRREQDRVAPKHLETLAAFVSGRTVGNQTTLWPLYSFDVIPLEFVSSIYEEFVTSTGAHYTPPFLVDFMLDEVLPWDEKEWNLRILDPACGSGIFLVKAYQRLIQRWKNAHNGGKPPTAILRRLLENNIFGVDIDPHAVRVASFSLYLTMCDEIDPKTYLRNTTFPRLRTRTLIDSDFFSERCAGFRTDADAGKYDLVVGNSPWGKQSLTNHARQWAEDPDRKWDISNKALGTLFLPKSIALARRGGRVSMIQPAGALLFNKSGTACRFRERLFMEIRVDQVVNLSPLRFDLFEDASSPPCIITLTNTSPTDDSIIYISPKQHKQSSSSTMGEGAYDVIIEPHDVAEISPHEAAFSPYIWTSLAWGGRRDFALITKLSRHDNLAKREIAEEVISRKGIVRGKKEFKVLSEIDGMPILENPPQFPADTFLTLDVDRLPINDNPRVDKNDSTTTAPFRPPQLIVKKAWNAESQRLQAAIVGNANESRGVVCSQSFVSVHGDRHLLERASVVCNSTLAVYFLLLTSGRLASYRPEPLAEELLELPIPDVIGENYDQIRDFAQADELVLKGLNLKTAERVLIEDLCKYTLPDFKGNAMSPGRLRVRREKQEPLLSQYCAGLIRVLKAGFGQQQTICATIFQDSLDSPLPLRIIAIHLESDHETRITVEPIDSSELCERLSELDAKYSRTDATQGGVYFQRVARIYTEAKQGRRIIPTIYIVKPDQVRYWTRSAAMRDADEIAADVLQWSESRRRGKTERKAK